MSTSAAFPVVWRVNVLLPEVAQRVIILPKVVYQAVLHVILHRMAIS